jgi:hypothetical protein
MERLNYVAEKSFKSLSSNKGDGGGDDGDNSGVKMEVEEAGDGGCNDFKILSREMVQYLDIADSPLLMDAFMTIPR